MSAMKRIQKHENHKLPAARGIYFDNADRQSSEPKLRKEGRVAVRRERR